MANNASKPLEGINVLVTRPAHQAQSLCDKIEGLGGRVLRLPVIEIGNPSDFAAALNKIKKLDKFEIAIFISSNAVEKTHALIATHGSWPEKIKIAAVGKHTAEALQKIGKFVDIVPQHQFNSEALLALEEMHDVKNKHIIIFRGEGGREVLAQTLRKRGAQVEYAEVYRRLKPDNDISKVQNAGKAGKIHMISVTSNEGLRNLYEIVGNAGHDWLLNTPVAVISHRMADLAHQLGFKESVIASHTSDQGLVDTIKEWYAIKRFAIE